MRIRAAGERDLEDICRIMCSTEPFTSLGYTRDRCCEAAIAAVEEGWALVAEDEGRVVGFVLFRVFDGFPLGGYIRAIAVDRGYRGKGVGSSLMEAAERTILKYRSNVFLLVSSFNEAAIRFYEARGYVKIGEVEDALARGETEIIMRKRKPAH